MAPRRERKGEDKSLPISGVSIYVRNEWSIKLYKAFSAGTKKKRIQRKMGVNRTFIPNEGGLKKYFSNIKFKLS